MARAYQCDFCGGFFAFNAAIPTSIRFGLGEHVEFMRHDICPACLADIARVIDIEFACEDKVGNGLKKRLMPYARPKQR